MSHEDLRQLFERVAALWPAYRAAGTVDSQHELYALICNRIPAQLAEVVRDKTHLKLLGSTGSGRVTAAPWIATFDPKVTRSAQEGYYPIYFFSVDLRRLYLAIAFGFVDFERAYGNSDEMRHQLRRAARKMQAMLPSDPVDYITGTIDLTTDKSHKLHTNYEYASIIALEYNTSLLCHDEELREDYARMVQIYQSLVNSSAAPAPTELLDDSLPIPEGRRIEARDFAPRAPLLEGEQAGGLRRSRASNRVGAEGELLVIEYERQRLAEQGRTDLADRVDYPAGRNEYPGWDVLSFETDGGPRYIEVKSSHGARIESVELTRNEWRAATDPRYRERYHIYLVSEALGAAPHIEILRAPGERVSRGELALRPSVYELSLRSEA